MSAPADIAVSESGFVARIALVQDGREHSMPPVLRLPISRFSSMDLVPGEHITVNETLTLPVLPSATLEREEIGVSDALARKHGFADGDEVTVAMAPTEKVSGSVNPGQDSLSFSDVGGLGPELGSLRELVELPLLRPEIFKRLGIEPPRGVLLSGPPGCGKTLIARALAQETRAAFFHIAGPEIADKHFGASEARLREIFDAASDAAPAIIFIDEIDSIAPSREALSGEKQTERRMVAQLLTLMDGLNARGDVVVLAATNLPDLLDPALRRPGRFDREIIISPPDVAGRLEILNIQSRTMSLAEDLDLQRVARRCHGFVGADLANLVREAGMAALRRHMPGPIGNIVIGEPDFDVALGQVRPSALRSVEMDIPQTQWCDIAGAQAAKSALRQAVEWPLAYPDHFEALGLKAPKGIMLHGPPGTGKTMLARALAHAAEANFVAINAGELLSMYLGESERAIRSVFARARSSAPTVLFFDEMDALAPKRSDRLSETTGRVVAQLLVEMDGLTSASGVFVLGATNRLSDIDPAILRPGRFDLKIHIGLPTVEDRVDLLELYIGKTPCAQMDFEQIARACDGFSGAEVAELVRAARQACLARMMQSDQIPEPEDLVLIGEDFQTVLAAMEPMA